MALSRFSPGGALLAAQNSGITDKLGNSGGTASFKHVCLQSSQRRSDLVGEMPVSIG